MNLRQGRFQELRIWTLYWPRAERKWSPQKARDPIGSDWGTWECGGHNLRWLVSETWWAEVDNSVSSHVENNCFCLFFFLPFDGRETRIHTARTWLYSDVKSSICTCEYRSNLIMLPCKTFAVYEHFLGFLEQAFESHSKFHLHFICWETEPRHEKWPS